jgi:hypothetical protein
MARKRGSDRHPANLRSVPDGHGESSGGHLRAVPDLPRLLPTLVPGDDEDPEVDPFEVFEMSLPVETFKWLCDKSFSRSFWPLGWRRT